jgi:glycosyltransferase involved in cell wall biosynthesis
MKVAFYAGFGKQMTGGPQVLVSLLRHLPVPPGRKIVLARTEGPITALAMELGCPTYVLGGLERYTEFRRASGLRRLTLLLVPFELLRFALRIHRVLRRERPDVLWVRNIKGVVAVAGGAWLSGTPLVWDIGIEPSPTGIVGWLHALGFRLARLVVAEGENVFARSFPPSLTRRFRHKLRVLPSGLDPAKARRLEATARRSDGRDEFIILSVGTLCRRKNQGMLLEAVEPLLDRYAHLSVLIVGGEVEPGYARALRARHARSLGTGRVRFLGWRSDVPELMGSAHLLAHVSRNEGVPYVVLEAFHASLPVVATRTGGTPDVIADGESGFLVEVNDVAALRSRLTTCIEQPDIRAALAHNGHRVVQERYTIDRWIAAYQHLLEQVAR